MTEKEFLIKQIKGVSKLISKILFQKEDFTYVLPKEISSYDNYDKLFVEINDMLFNNEINKAEDLLFKNLDGMNYKALQIALNFYESLVNKPDEELKKYDFSLEEVEQGFFDMLNIYNIKVERK